MPRFFSWISTYLDLEDMLFFLGLALIAIGVALVSVSSACILVGVLLVLSVPPLLKWMK